MNIYLSDSVDGISVEPTNKVADEYIYRNIQEFHRQIEPVRRQSVLFNKPKKEVCSMVTTIMLHLFLLFIVLSIGGGLYETLVVYPNWKRNVHPETLQVRLEWSGQLNANKRFWPIVSPAQTLLAIVNLIMAIKYAGPAHIAWVSASMIIVVSRVITFGYFIPVMLKQIMQPEHIEEGKLVCIVKRWTTLSPLRIIAEFVAWLLIAYTTTIL